MYAATQYPCSNDTLEDIYLTMDDDVTTGFYSVKNTADNYIKLDTYDTITKTFTGRFAGTYLKKFGDGPKKIAVTNGRFYGKILN
jgi:hypothetical protein